MLEPAPKVRTESRSATAAKRPVAFDLKGTMAPLTVLRLRATDIALVERQLRVKIAQLPQLFIDAPVVLDLGALGDDEPRTLPFAELVRVLKLCKLVAGRRLERARGAARRRRRGGARRPAAPAGPARGGARRGRGTGTPIGAARDVRRARRGDAAAGARPPRRAGRHQQPVRSGQIVYAQNNDLVVLAPVNPGAQLLADGNIHIYAPLRGRAVAGAQGLLGARIFCQKLEAELVAIAGAYVMSDEIPAERRGKPAQIYLDGGECRIAAL